MDITLITLGIGLRSLFLNGHDGRNAESQLPDVFYFFFKSDWLGYLGTISSFTIGCAFLEALYWITINILLKSSS